MSIVVVGFVIVAMLQDGTASAEQPLACDPAALTDAITQANTAGSGTIRLASECVYSVSTPATVNEAFPVITGDIAIIGGKNTTIARAPSSATQFRVFTVDLTGTLSLRKLSVEGGDSTGLGGGVLNNGTLAVKDVIFRNNKGGNGGGFSNSAGATATVSKSTFILNTTTGVGGGAFLNAGVVTVKKSFIANNNAPINGGGINTQPGGDTTVTDSTFQFNTSGGLGGGLSNLGKTTIERCLITRNTGSSGGAIATGNDQVIVERSVILANDPDNCSPLNTIAGCAD